MKALFQPSVPIRCFILATCIGCGDIVGQAILPPDGENSLSPDMSRVPLRFDDSGWISRSDNALGIQGPWDVIAGEASAIDGAFENGTAVRVVGTATPDPAGEDYTNYFGAKIGFHLCADESIRYFDDNAAHTAGECPFNDILSRQIMGVSFSLDGHLPATELRVQLSEKGRQDGTYKVVSGSGPHTVWFSETKIHYDPEAEPFHKEGFNGIMFYISSTGGPTSFDFYINDLAIWAYLP